MLLQIKSNEGLSINHQVAGTSWGLFRYLFSLTIKALVKKG